MIGCRVLLVTTGVEYRRLEIPGAEALTEWVPYRVSGDALRRLAQG